MLYQFNVHVHAPWSFVFNKSNGTALLTCWEAPLWITERQFSAAEFWSSILLVPNQKNKESYQSCRLFSAIADASKSWIAAWPYRGRAWNLNAWPYPGPPLPTDPIREQQAVASVSEAVPRQLDGDHGRATSSQSQSALWIYEAVGHAEMDWSSYGSTDFPS